SRVRLHDLTRLGRSRTGWAALQAAPPERPLRAASPAPLRSFPSSSGAGLAARPRAASSRPGADDLSRSAILHLEEAHPAELRELGLVGVEHVLAGIGEPELEDPALALRLDDR